MENMFGAFIKMQKKNPKKLHLPFSNTVTMLLPSWDPSLVRSLTFIDVNKRCINLDSVILNFLDVIYWFSDNC